MILVCITLIDASPPSVKWEMGWVIGKFFKGGKKKCIPNPIKEWRKQKAKRLFELDHSQGIPILKQNKIGTPDNPILRTCCVLGIFYFRSTKNSLYLPPLSLSLFSKSEKRFYRFGRGSFVLSIRLFPSNSLCALCCGSSLLSDACSFLRRC